MYEETLPFNFLCLEHILLVLVIAEVDVTELDDTLLGPGLAGHIAGLAGLVLLGQLGVLHHPLHSGHQVLHLQNSLYTCTLSTKSKLAEEDHTQSKASRLNSEYLANFCT